MVEKQTYWIVKKSFYNLCTGDIIEAAMDVGVYAIKVIKSVDDIKVGKEYTFISPSFLIKYCERISSSKLKDFLEIFDCIL